MTDAAEHQFVEVLRWFLLAPVQPLIYVRLLYAGEWVEISWLSANRGLVLVNAEGVTSKAFTVDTVIEECPKWLDDLLGAEDAS